MVKSEGKQVSPQPFRFEAFCKQPLSPQRSDTTIFTLREEQQTAVDKALAYYQVSQVDPKLSPHFLWNAKPRFGKTLAAYCFAAKIHARSVLIVTNRPAIADSWYSDFRCFGFQVQDYPVSSAQSAHSAKDPKSTQPNLQASHRWIFTSSTAVKQRLTQPSNNINLGKTSPDNIYTREQQLADPNLLAQNFIHFISLQDIKSKDLEGFKRKNSWIFEYGEGNRAGGWDLVIIDESHEGADTDRAFQVFAKMPSKFTLHLSGTPFKALARQQFSPAQVYHWTYLDEQRQKTLHAQEHNNPYAALPKLHFFTYQLPRLLETERTNYSAGANDYLYDFAELFRLTKVDNQECFAHELQVRAFIKKLSSPDKSYPFSNPDSYNHLRHTFWLLPGVQACHQFKELLLKDKFFKRHYAPDDIIIAAGKTSTALQEVQQRTRQPLSSRTITLSCGQLTTGVTIPAWTGIFMLCNCQSPSFYIQSVFRAQNPCQISLSSEQIVKQNCFIYDFSPDQSLRTLAYIAGASDATEPVSSRKQKIRELTQYLPVFAESDNGTLQPLDANAIMNIPLRLASNEVLARKFMSNRLFRNINHIFGCPPEIVKIVEKIHTPASRKISRICTQPRIWLDRAKVIHINEDIIIPTRDGFMGEREYVELGTPEAEEISSILQLAVKQARAANYPPAAIHAIRAALAKKLPQLVVQLPDYPAAHVKEAPDAPPHAKEQSDESKVRERLRNFARNVPTLLMAYGDQNSRLANFDTIAPDEIFTELTGLTKNEFRKLRDGMDFQTLDESGQSVTQHFDGFLDEAVFDAAIQQFLQKRTALAKYYDIATTEDIFEYIPAQAAHQVFTPRAVAKASINQLVAHRSDIFKSTTNTFFDPYMKSGAYITEIVKQLFRHTRSQYPDDEACIRHILEHQVYGLAPTPVLQAITQNYLFGFDHEHKISRQNFRQVDITTAAKKPQFESHINSIFDRGEAMKFTAVVGNPPYMESKRKTQAQTQASSNWIYHYFQQSAEQVAELTCLIYPFGGWFDSPERLGGFGRKLLSDGHTVSIDAYESTADARAWYRHDRQPQPVFGHDANLSAGVSIVLRDLTNHYDAFWYSNRIYTDERITVKTSSASFLPPNPSFHKIYQKLYGTKLRDRIEKNIFGIESNFVATHPHLVSTDPADWRNPVQLLANDRAGSAGRTKLYWMDRSHISKGAEFIDQYKVVTTAAYPKKTFVTNRPTISDVKQRLQELIEILPRGSAFGRSRLALFLSDSREECDNFLKYTQTNFFAAMLLQEPNRRSYFGDIIPDQDFTAHSDIDWQLPLAEIDQQLCQKYQLTASEVKSLGICS